MLRLYNEETPLKNDIIVVCLDKLEEDKAHKCSLLEYGGLQGVIVKVQPNKKTKKKFDSLKEGNTFLIMVHDVNLKKNADDITTIDLYYVELEQEQIKTHLGRYQQFLNIVNAFTYIVSENEQSSVSKQELRKQRKLLKHSDGDEEPTIVSFNYKDQDEHVKAKVYIIMTETLHKYPTIIF